MSLSYSGGGGGGGGEVEDGRVWKCERDRLGEGGYVIIARFRLSCIGDAAL